MSRDQDNLRKSLKKRSPPAEYDVGYRKPPGDSRFKPGQSGNPSGRPKGRKNRPKVPAPHEERLKAIILEEAYRTITVNDSNRQVTMSMAQAVMRSLGVNAARGNQRAQSTFLEIVALAERDKKRLHDELLQAAVEYKIDWEIELERRAALGIDGPEPLPHPDHVNIDPVTGNVRITGPLTKEDKAEWDWLRERKEAFDDEIKAIQQTLENESDCPHRDLLIKDLERDKRLRELISRVIPD